MGRQWNHSSAIRVLMVFIGKRLQLLGQPLCNQSTTICRLIYLLLCGDTGFGLDAWCSGRAVYMTGHRF